MSAEGGRRKAVGMGGEGLSGGARPDDQKKRSKSRTKKGWKRLVQGKEDDPRLQSRSSTSRSCRNFELILDRSKTTRTRKRRSMATGSGALRCHFEAAEATSVLLETG